jgi:hypothetical protein
LPFALLLSDITQARRNSAPGKSPLELNHRAKEKCRATLEMRRRRGHLALTTRIDSLRCRPLVGERLLSGKKRRSPKGLSAFFISRRIAGGGVGRQRGAGLVATASGRPCLWRRHFRMECVPRLSSLRLLRRGPTCTLGSGATHLSHLRRSAVTGSHKTPKDQRQRKRGAAATLGILSIRARRP